MLHFAEMKFAHKENLEELCACSKNYAKLLATVDSLPAKTKTTTSENFN